MSLQRIMSKYAGYNLWANRTLVTWLKTKPAGLLEQEVPSSFPSLVKTIVHIWDTERFWISVLKGVPPPPSFRFHNYNGTSEEAMESLVAQSEEFDNYIDTLWESDLMEECNLDTPWVKGTLPKYEFIQHCFNHSTYHRGQLITIGRNIGLTDAPMTDYNFYNMVTLKTQVLEKNSVAA